MSSRRCRGTRAAFRPGRLRGCGARRSGSGLIKAERPLAHLVALDLSGRRCVVVGGGAVASQRVPGLLDAGALVTVVAARIEPFLQALADRRDISWVARPYRPGDLCDATLVLNTGEDPTIEAPVRDEAHAAGALLNTHDRPHACDFAMPARLRRGRLQVAVSTSGDSPHVAAAVRERLESLLGEEWGAQLALVARVRRKLRRAGTPIAEQRAIYRRLTRESVRSRLRRDGDDGIGDRPEVAATQTTTAGVVHLVGAGPGDPGLLTVRARDLLLDADVVFHDALVAPATLALCGRHTRIVDVGKRAGGTSIGQDEIIGMLVDAARSGLEVVRLKGGDPFVLGRGGEELAALRAAGIAADVVPGVTSAFAAPAAAGIPVTMRGVSGSVAVISGQDRHGNVPENLERVAAAVDTLVVLMPLRSLDAIAARLARTLGGDRPAALIANATTEAQRVIVGNLATIARAARDSTTPAPATLLTGWVVHALDADRDAPAIDGALTGGFTQQVSRA